MSVDGIDLNSCDNNQEKDLGVITSASMIWSLIRSMLQYIKPTINDNLRDRKTMLTIYKALNRPHIEYCVRLWNPVAEFGNWSLILALECVQRRFTCLIDEIGTLHYSQRSDILNLTTLAERRNRGNLIEAYKAVDGNYIIGNLFNIGRLGII